MKKKLLLSILVFVLVCTIVARVYYVNLEAPRIPLEEYSINDVVELDGAFLQMRDENTQGYSVKVTGAQLMSYNTYIERYGQDQSSLTDGLDQDSIVVLDVEIENVSNENGRLFVIDWKLVTGDRNDYLLRDDFLWRQSEPALAADSGPILNFSLKKDSKYLTHIPFKININDEFNQRQYKRELERGEYTLEITRSPVKKVIKVYL